MQATAKDYIHRLWLTLIGLYTVVFLAAYTLGLSAKPIDVEQVKTICTMSSPASLYGIFLYVTPLLGQAFFSETTAIEGLCVSHLYGSLGLSYIVVEYLYTTMLALLIAVPSADSTLIVSLLVMYLIYRRGPCEVVKDRLRAIIKSGLVAYAQHVLLTIVVLLLIVLAFRLV